MNTFLRDQLQVTVYGTPGPQGSKRLVNGHMIEASAKVKPWREDVKLAALRALGEAPEWDRACREVSVSLNFTLVRPRSHYRSGRHANLIRPNAPAWCWTKPDLDKLVRSTCDALGNAGVYADDSRIVMMTATKCYTADLSTETQTVWAMDRPGAVLLITTVDRL